MLLEHRWGSNDQMVGGGGVGVLVREEVTLKENLNSEEELTMWG